MAFDMPFDNAQNHRSYIVLWNRHTDAMKCINWFLLFMTQPYPRYTSTAKSALLLLCIVNHPTTFANFYRIVMLHRYCSIYFERKFSGEIPFFRVIRFVFSVFYLAKKEVEQLLGWVIYSNPQLFTTCIITSISSSSSSTSHTKTV